jgi:hypothetical protein
VTKPRRQKPKSLRIRRSDDEKAAAQQVYLDKLKEKGLISDALELAGINQGILDGWRKDEEFKAREAGAFLKRDDTIREAVMDLVRDKNPSVVIHASKMLPEFKTTTKHELNVTGRVEHAHVLEGLPQSERDRIIRDAAKIIELEKGEGYE